MPDSQAERLILLALMKETPMATTHSRLLVRTTLGITMISAFALTSCATDERAIFQDGKVAASEPTETSKSDNSTDIQHDDVLLAEVDDPIEFERCVAAEDIDGRPSSGWTMWLLQRMKLKASKTRPSKLMAKRLPFPVCRRLKSLKSLARPAASSSILHPVVVYQLLKFPIPTYPDTGSPSGR